MHFAESRAWFDEYNYRDSLQSPAIEGIGYCGCNFVIKAKGYLTELEISTVVNPLLDNFVFEILKYVNVGNQINKEIN